MLIPAIPLFRRRKGRPRPAAPPAALTLVGASFFDGGGGAMILRLVFNKPVDVSDILPGQLIVDDGAGDIQWEGQGPVTLVNPSTVQVGMFEMQAQAYPDTRLTATPPTGIVAVDDGEPWTGVAALLLPFP